MTGPLLILGVLSVLGGFHALYPSQIVDFLLPDIARVADMSNHLWMNVLGLVAWVGGLVLARKIYGAQSGDNDPLADKSPALFQLSNSKLFFDEIYSFYVKKIQDPFFRFLEVMELLFISGLLVRGSAGVAALFALLGKSFYSGKIHSYSFWFVSGTIGFLAYAIFSGGSN